MVFAHRNHGTCSQAVRFEIEGNTVKNVEFFGGCNGNLKGISALVEGMDMDEVIHRMKGIRCGYKDTSCPDQLAQALEAAKAKLEK